MIVISAFDGMACGRQSLHENNQHVDEYFSLEIDKYAMSIASRNHPRIKQMGDITVDLTSRLPATPDLLMGGSPCQGFSKAGKQLNFDDPRSKLFFNFVDLLNDSNPTYFLLENVYMKQEWQDVISKELGVQPIVINSKLVSAQNRKRLYWTNIPGVTQPEDERVMLKDIVFQDATKPTVCMHNLYGGFGETKHRVFIDKSPTIRTAAGGGHIPSLLLSDKALAYMDKEVKGGRTHWDFKHHSDAANDKSATVVANFFKGVPYSVLKDEDCIRHFHPVECERLQTLPDNYTYGVSKTQRLKMIGNGWNVKTIRHILKGIRA